MKKLFFKLGSHEFAINCAAEDDATMRAAAEQVERLLQEVRKEYRVSDSGRAALITALLVAFKAQKGDNNTETTTKRRRVAARIDDVLARTVSPAEAQHNNTNQLMK